MAVYTDNIVRFKAETDGIKRLVQEAISTNKKVREVQQQTTKHFHQTQSQRIASFRNAEVAIARAAQQSAQKQQQLSKLSTKQLVSDYVKVQNEKKNIIRAIENEENASVRRVLVNKKRALDQELREFKSNALQRGEVLREGAGAGAGILGVGRKLIGASGLGKFAGAAGVAIGLKEFIEFGAGFEDAMADVSAITGVTGDSLDNLTLRVRENAKTFGIDAIDAANAYKLVISALGPAVAKNQADLESMSKSVMTLAKASGTDASTAAEALTTTLNQFGFATADSATQAKEMNRIMNVMAAGSKEGAAEVPQLADSIKDVGTIAFQAGLGIEETVGALEIFSQAGVKGGDAGTLFRNTLLNMQSGSKDAADALAAMGLSFADINPKVVGLERGMDRLRGGLQKLKTPTEQANALVKIFGERGVIGANILMKATENAEGAASAYRKMTVAVTGTQTADEQMAVRMNTTSEKFKQAVGSIKDFALGIYETLQPSLNSLLGTLNSILGPMAKFLGQMQQAVNLLGVPMSGGGVSNLHGTALSMIKANVRKQMEDVAQEGGQMSREDLEAIVKEQYKKAGLEKYTKSIQDTINELLFAQTSRTLQLQRQEQESVAKNRIQKEYETLLKTKPSDPWSKEAQRRRLEELKKLGAVDPAPDVLGAGTDGKADEKAKREAKKREHEEFEVLKQKLINERELTEARGKFNLAAEEQYLRDMLNLAEKYHEQREAAEAKHQIDLFNIKYPPISKEIQEVRGRIPGLEGFKQIREGDPITGEKRTSFSSQLMQGDANKRKKIEEQFYATEDAMVELRESEREAWSQWTSQLSDAFTSAFDVINQGFFSKIDEAFNTSNNIAGAFFGSLIKGLVQAGEQIAIQALETAILNAIVGGIATTTASTILGAAAPAAMAMSIATVGGAAAAGAGAFHAAMASTQAVPGMAHGGIVQPQYFEAGGHVLDSGSLRLGYVANAFQRKKSGLGRGTDTALTMLTPGEGVLTTREMGLLGGPNGFAEFRNALRTGMFGAQSPQSLRLGYVANATDRPTQTLTGEMAMSRPTTTGGAGGGGSMRDLVKAINGMRISGVQVNPWHNRSWIQQSANDNSVGIW